MLKSCLSSLGDHSIITFALRSHYVRITFPLFVYVYMFAEEDPQPQSPNPPPLRTFTFLNRIQVFFKL